MTGPMNRWQRLAGALLCALAASGVALAADVAVTVQGPDGQPLPGAVVFVDSAQASQAAKPLTQAEMAQQGKAFVPDVLVVTRGTSVHFPNRDTVRHHVYSFSPTKKFELKLYIGTPANPVVFDQAGVAVLGCNIHDHMVGWVMVLDTPYFAQTQANGQAALAGVPPGKYTLRVWHQRLPMGAPAQAQSLTVSSAGTQATVRLTQVHP